MGLLGSMFKRKDSSQAQGSSAIDVCTALLPLGKKAGYVYDDKAFPNIPEVMVQATTVVKDLLAAFLMARYSNPSTLCAWACYAGIGAVWKWNEDWGKLKRDGIFQTLVSPRGLDEMDEYVTDGIGWEFGSEKSDAFVDHLHLTSAIAIAKASEKNNSKELKAVEDAMIAMYYYGMIIEMNNLGMH